MKFTPKIFVMIALVLSVLLLGGCQAKLPEKSTTTKPEEGKSVFESIKDAMIKSISLKCDYSTGEIKSTVYLKGKSIYSESETKGIKNYTILKEEKLWAWSDKDKKGIYLDLSSAKEKPKVGDYKTQEEMVEELEAQKQNCQPAVVSDSLFNPPTTIQFQDLNQLFEKFGQP